MKFVKIVTVQMARVYNNKAHPSVYVYSLFLNIFQI